MNLVQIPARGSDGRYLPIPHHFPGNHSGIYAIINRLNGKLYIGSAAELARRWRQHRHDSKKGITCSNRYFARAFARHGDVFDYEVLEFVDNPERLIEREQFWIDFFRSNKPQFGYNITPIAQSCLGHKLSDETKMKLSIALTGRKQSPETIAKRVSKLTNFYAGRRPLSEETKRKLSIALTGKKRIIAPDVNAERSRKIGLLKSKPVIQLHFDGTEIRRWPSITAAEKFFKKRSNISSACNGKRNKAFGFRWKYAIK